MGLYIFLGILYNELIIKGLIKPSYFKYKILKMVTINNDGSSASDSKLDPSAGRSSRTILLIIVVSILILTAVIFFLRQKIWPSVNLETGQEKQKIVIPKVIYNLAGLVQKMEENSFILEASIPQLDKNGNPTQIKEIRRVKITPLTRFSRLTFVAQEGKVGKAPVETLITFKDIKGGDYIEVISNQDISHDKEFEASQIRTLPQSF
jgi:hypothetical protein